MDSQNNQTDPLSIPIPDEVKNYLEGLISEAGLTPIDDAMKEEILNELYVRLDNFLTSRIIENMPPEHLDEFIKLNEESRSKEEIDNFMKEKIPNSQEMFTQAFVDFRDLYLGNTGVTKPN